VSYHYNPVAWDPWAEPSEYPDEVDLNDPDPHPSVALAEELYNKMPPKKQKEMDSLSCQFKKGDLPGEWRIPVRYWRSFILSMQEELEQMDAPEIGYMATGSPTIWTPRPEWRLEDLSEFDEEIVYHGTRALTIIQHEGLCAPVADVASGDDYGWEDVWKSEVGHSYRKMLDTRQRRRFNSFFGRDSARLFRNDELGGMVSLFWITMRKKTAEAYLDQRDSAVLEVDLSQLNYYWFFEDDILGESSYVFVMPTECPQAPPEAFEVVG